MSGRSVAAQSPRRASDPERAPARTGGALAGGALLSDADLRDEIAAGRLMIHPYEDALVQPASIDVRLHSEFMRFRTDLALIDPAQMQLLMQRADPERGMPFILAPGEFALASTRELIVVPPHLAVRVEGKSSLARLGLALHCTAGWVDPGFQGRITLELSNLAPLPIALWPGMRIGQLAVMALRSPAATPYGSPELGSHYQHQSGVGISNSWARFERDGDADE